MNDTVPEPLQTVNPAISPPGRDFLAMLKTHIEAYQYAQNTYCTAHVGFVAIFCNVLENCRFLYSKSSRRISGTAV
ncbi:hypothetical protein [Gluconobacter oxydans]|uniref:hypothetical protein n=1 Tax=Gluconobacter oxydans TaxID=442 RepID=UPI001CD8CB2A|nr:hypothetical protein [Gluconobacter oxydans]